MVPNKCYKNRKNRYEKLLVKQNKVIKSISIMRMIVFVCAIVLPIVFYYTVKNVYLGIVSFFISMVAFIIFAVKHEKVINKRNLTENLININIEGLDRLEGKWKSFKDDGAEYKDESHSYSNDLDIFGRASLFQYINDTTTYMGRENLKNTLENPNCSIEQINKRQSAIKEMSKMIPFRQRLKGEGLKDLESKKNPKDLLKWAKEINNIYESKFMKFITIFLPAITIGAILYYLLGIVKSYYVPLIFIIVNVIILRFNKDNRKKSLDMVWIYKRQINDYYNMLRIIEKKKFKSQYLRDLQKNLIDEKTTASKEVKKLNKLSDIIQDRNNFLYFFLNYLFLWDYHCMINLEKWKKDNGNKLEKWLDCIGKMEEISSLSSLGFNNDKWTIPIIKEGDIVLKGENMGHPLLGEGKVCNNLTIGNDNKIILITGSNMSGKSTFLRTSGINLVLAYSGAAVCATKFECSLMNIFTCMRISDNLEKNISSFYGELIRIRELVNKTKENRRIFFLLDEIFKGTNSIDRHTGAKILINKLSKENAFGMVSTHDLELGSLETENKKVKNYHFREYYKENKIKFDYKLREGVSNTRNAMYLMKIAGIVENE